jgi:lipid-binding SYLF domain-containing protein
MALIAVAIPNRDPKEFVMLGFLSITLSLSLGGSSTPAPPASNARTLERATELLDELAAIPLKGIPTELLSEAQGVAIVPRVIKAGFVFGGRGGHGIVLARDVDGNWGEPVFVNLGGASVGFQAGVESTDVVLVFRNRRSLERLLDGKGKLTLGADASVAAGPVGRMAAAATDARLEAEILSYSRGRGVFVGVSIDGAIIRADAMSNAIFHQTGSETERELAESLRTRLAKLSKERPRAAAPPVLEPPIRAPIRPR